MEDWEADIRVAETRRRVRFEEKSGREPRKVRGQELSIMFTV